MARLQCVTHPLFSIFVILLTVAIIYKYISFGDIQIMKVKKNLIIFFYHFFINFVMLLKWQSSINIFSTIWRFSAYESYFYFYFPIFVMLLKWQSSINICFSQIWWYWKYESKYFLLFIYSTLWCWSKWQSYINIFCQIWRYSKYES
jgi:hypothetical protein